MRDVRLMKRESTALSKHAIQSEHEIDWENPEIFTLKMIMLNENLSNHILLTRKIIV